MDLQCESMFTGGKENVETSRNKMGTTVWAKE